MDPNGNQWQQDNRTRIDAIKQEIANLKRQLERNGNNLRLVLKFILYHRIIFHRSFQIFNKQNDYLFQRVSQSSLA